MYLKAAFALAATSIALANAAALPVSAAILDDKADSNTIYTADGIPLNAGLYVHDHHDNGTVTSTYLSAIPDLDDASVARDLVKLLRERDFPQYSSLDNDNDNDNDNLKRDLPSFTVGCDNTNVISLDWAGATLALSQACAAGSVNIGSKQTYTAVSGDAVAYLCNYAKGNNGCSAGELSQALGHIGNKCPNYQAGWLFIQSWSKTYGFTSTRNSAGASFCTNLMQS